LFTSISFFSIHQSLFFSNSLELPLGSSQGILNITILYASHLRKTIRLFFRQRFRDRERCACPALGRDGGLVERREGKVEGFLRECPSNIIKADFLEDE
jgi:hypothetical protein